MRYQECYATLGLAPGATFRQAHRAYKKLALRFHPDRNGDDAYSHEQFCRVTEAYATLRSAMQNGRETDRSGPCKKCDRFAALFLGLDGGRYCARCLLGTRRKMLPLPIYTTIKCLLVISLQAGAVYYLVNSISKESWRYGAAAVVLALVSILALAHDVWSADVIEK